MEVVGLIVEVLGVLGVFLAIYQIYRTGRVAFATHKSVEHTSKQLGVYSVLLALAELNLVEHRLDSAVSRVDPDDAKRILRDWQARASELRGLLSADLTGEVDTAKLARLVQASLTQATRAKERINEGQPLPEATSAILASCEQVVLTARSITTLIQSSPPSSLTERSGWDEFFAMYWPKRQKGALR
jgi:hypothetical protein